MTRLLAINMNSVRNLRAQSKSEISKDYNNFFCKSVLTLYVLLRNRNFIIGQIVSFHCIFAKSQEKVKF